jgi:hypothetical protein
MSECRSGRLQAFRQAAAIVTVRQRTVQAVPVQFSQRTVQPAYSSSASVLFSQRSVQPAAVPRPPFSQRLSQARARSVQPAFRSGHPERCPSVKSRTMSECRSGPLNNVRVPFQPAFRVLKSPNDVRVPFRSPNNVRVPPVQRVPCLSPRTMSECRSGLNDVRVPFRRLQAFRQPPSYSFSQRTVQAVPAIQFSTAHSVQLSGSPASVQFRPASVHTVPFRPAFRSGQRSVQLSTVSQASVPFSQRSVQARPVVRSA